VRANADVRFEAPGYDPFPQRDFGWTTWCMSRPLIEFVIRSLAATAPHVEFRPRCRVRALETGEDGSAIAAAQVEYDGGASERLAADLVVDASGRAGPTLTLLKSLGRPAPAETSIGVDFAYATAIFETPADAPTDWKVLMTQPDIRVSARGGLLAPLEHGRWILSVGGRAGDAPPDEPEAFLDFVAGLRTPTMYEAIRGARRVGDVARYGFRESVWRHFETVEGWPRGLIPFGDSICRFNPVYGQGMSVAALEGVLLGRLLADHAAGADPVAGVTTAFLAGAPGVIQAPWDMSAIPDLIFPATRGERPANLAQIMAYGMALGVLAGRDGAVHRLDAEVRALLKPPTVLLEPALAARVMEVMAELRAPA
jgi:2-polyprenyl-6-methoxyphenol hydroxylase-like FAD-dependent oxidoreductase